MDPMMMLEIIFIVFSMMISIILIVICIDMILSVREIKKHNKWRMKQLEEMSNYYKNEKGGEVDE